MADRIDSHVSLEQAKLAISALYKHATKVQKEKEADQLLPGREQHIWLVVGTKKIYPEGKLKPFRIPVKHVIVDPREANICLITKDPQRVYKDLLGQHNIKFITRVVGIEKLKGKWKPFEARRLLLKENGLFLADDRVVPLLPKLLGKIFFEAKKQPIPIRLTKKDLRAELESAINSTYMHQNQGNCTSIKIATLNHTPAQILENLQTALPVIISRIRDGWENIQNLHIKTSNSISLPIWTCDLSDGPEGRWHGLTHGKGEEWGGIESGSTEVEDSKDSSTPADTPAPTKPPKRKGIDEDPSTKVVKKARGELAEATPSIPTSKPRVKPKPLDVLPSTPTSKQTRPPSTASPVDVVKKMGTTMRERSEAPSTTTAALVPKRTPFSKNLDDTLTTSGAKQKKTNEATVIVDEKRSKAVSAELSNAASKKSKSKGANATSKDVAPLKSAMKKKPQSKVSIPLSTEIKKKKVQIIGVEKKKQKLNETSVRRHGAGAKANLIGKKRP